MVEILFRSIVFLKDQNIVLIEGECEGEIVDMSLSILQLAKVFGSDQKLGSFYGKHGFAIEELEKKCRETKKLISRYPYIDVWEREVECSFVSVENETWQHRSTDPDIIGIYAEDLMGWDNEGVRIKFPKVIYQKLINGRNIRVFIKPHSVEIRVLE